MISHPTFLDSLKADGRREKTITQYCRYVKRIAKWEAANAKLGQQPAPDHPSPQAVVAFIREIVTPITPVGTVMSWRAFGTRYCAWSGFEPGAPILPEKRGHAQHHFRESLTTEDLTRWSLVIHEAELPRTTNTILRLLPILGFRISEACELRWEGISEKPVRTWRFVGKGGAVATTILVDIAWGIIGTYRQWCVSQGYDVTKGYAFPGLFDGKHITPGAIRHHVRRLATIADLSKPIGPHVLRHTAATLMLESGESLKTVQEFLRHRRIETTALYAHTTQATQVRAMDKLGKLAEGDADDASE